MNYIIDCGFSTGVFSRRMLKRFRAEGDDLTRWTVLGYEPDPRWRDRWPTFLKEFPEPAVRILPKAIWIHNGEERFYPCKSGSSSWLAPAIHRSHESGRKASLIVPTVNLNDVLLSLEEPEKVVLKMDIEGGEFYVLPHIQENGGAEVLSHAFIEYHARLNRKAWLPIMVQIKEWWAAHPEISTSRWR